ncbi:MAG: hypothetical protein ACE5G9_06390 [Nitrospinales bacterium]
MEQKIHPVITERVRPTQAIVQRKAQKANKPGRIKQPEPVEVSEVFDSRIVDDGRTIIEMKRGIKGVAVAEKPHQRYEGKSQGGADFWNAALNYPPHG